MIISHVKIIAFQLKRIAMDVLLLFTEFCLYNKQKNTWVLGSLGNTSLILVLNMISHSFAALTREISYSTLKINLVFPRTHVLFSIYFICLAITIGLCINIVSSCAEL
jgi:hypothetical protein